MPNGRNWQHKYGWWCPRHPWPPPWVRAYQGPCNFYHPIPTTPIEELRMLENMKKDLEENIKRLETRIKELKENIEKEKTQ